MHLVALLQQQLRQIAAITLIPVIGAVFDLVTSACPAWFGVNVLHATSYPSR